MYSKNSSKKEAEMLDDPVEMGKFLKALIDLSPDILYIYDIVENRNVYSNEGIERILGYSIRELQEMGNTLIQTLMHPDDYTEYISKILPQYYLLKDNEPIIHQYRMMHKTGSWRYLESNEVIYQRTSDHKPCQIFGVIHDITKQKEMEISLDESDRLLQEAQQIAQIGHWNWDVDTNKLIWSDEIFNIFGVNRSTFPVSAESFDRTIHPDDFPAFSRERQKMLESYKDLSIAHRIILPDGEIRHVHERAHVVRDKMGNVVRVFGTVQDITDRNKIEEELQKSQKLESLGLLAGGIAHDFNNLMGGIFGYIDLANEASKEASVTSYLSKAMNTIDRARALTQQLLTFAKGGAPIQKVESLFPFVEETVWFALSGSNVFCHFDVPQDLWACNFDRNQIGQVIDNLIINSQQAMPVGGTIELSARNTTLAEQEHPVLSKGNYVRISVRDSGIGIPNDLLSKIFDPFFTTKAKGHGLGLATCYSIINRHGGCIDVESEPGKGSTFKVYLPASTEAVSSAIRESSKMHDGSGTFLIMDDEPVVRDAVGNMLETLGYTVISKENGKDAIDFYTSATKANLTVTGMIFDLTVPGGMGGIATIKEIRKTNMDIPAFVASGYADDPVMKNPTEHGFMSSICKPFRIAELSEMLNKYMKPKK